MLRKGEPILAAKYANFRLKSCRNQMCNWTFQLYDTYDTLETNILAGRQGSPGVWLKIAAELRTTSCCPS
eukprot:s2625_g8.t1